MISSKELLTRLGIRTPKTLTRWYQRGLIPEPIVTTHPSGRGKLAYWPDWVLARCLRIRELMDQGASLDQISSTLGQNWKDEEEKYRRRYRFQEAKAEADFQFSMANFEEMVLDRLADLLNQLRDDHRVLWQRLHAITQDGRGDRVLGPLALGYNLVLVVGKSNIEVVPDFLVSQLLADPSVAAPVCVIPISSLAKKAFASTVVGDLPESPTITLVAG